MSNIVIGIEWKPSKMRDFQENQILIELTLL